MGAIEMRNIFEDWHPEICNFAGWLIGAFIGGYIHHSLLAIGGG